MPALLPGASRDELRSLLPDRWHAAKWRRPRHLARQPPNSSKWAPPDAYLASEKTPGLPIRWMNAIETGSAETRI
jgi:hypothetical protein